MSNLFNYASLALTIVALVVTFFSVRYAKRSLYPAKRRLTLSALPPASLLSTDSATEAGVVVTHDGNPLDDPHVVTVTLESTGQHAVGSDQFDGARPITIDLGAPIKAVLRFSRLPDGDRQFAHEISGSSIVLGPDLLNPGGSVVIQALTEGPPSADLRSRVTSYLKDTEIEIRHPQTVADKSARTRRWSAVAPIVLTLLIGPLVIVGLIAALDSGPSVSISPDNGPTGTQLTITGSGFERYEVVRIRLEDMRIWITPTPGPLPTLTPRPGSTTIAEIVKPSPTPTYLTPEPIAMAQADDDGDFTITIVIPAGYPRGRLTITCDGEESWMAEQVYFHVR